MNIDLDEIRPDRFVIHNDKIKPWLKGEGVTIGKFFELGTWRRDGLLARLRERGFNIRTIDDRIAGLGAIGAVEPPGAEGVRALSQAKERIATFDAAELRWRDLPIEQVDNRAVVRLRAGEPLRRRKSRGQGEFYIATHSQQDQINLLPVHETEALLRAYAQRALAGPIRLRYTIHDDTIHVPQQAILLPTPHRTVLELIALDKAPAWTFPLAALPLATTIFAKLGITLQPAS